MKSFVILALIAVAVWSSSGTNIKDSVVLRVFNKDLRIPSAKMHELLKKANLESHGYTKEVVKQETTHPDSKDYTRTVHYHKIVPCNKAYEVEKELNRLLKGVLGGKTLRKTKKDLKAKNMNNPNRKCRVGVEIHFPDEQFCGVKKGGLAKRRPAPCNCFVCFCIVES